MGGPDRSLLRTYKAPSIKEIGTPLLMRISAPEVLAKFASGRVVMLFRKSGGCWLIDGRE